MYCWVQLCNILLKIFISKFMRDIGLWFSCFVLSLVLVSKQYCVYEICLKVSLPLLFSGKDCVKLMLILFKCLAGSLDKPSWLEDSFLGGQVSY